MIGWKQIPDEVQEEFDRAFVIEGKPFKLAFAAALAAWPGAQFKMNGAMRTFLILPLPK
jgi:hypothetical protein